MATIIETIVKADYMADGRQVETLTHSVIEGLRADGTYLRVLVAHLKARLGAPKRGRQAPIEPTLDKIHEELYPFVLRGVGPEDMEKPERNRLAGFARSAASTLRYFIRYGGDVRALDVHTVTKSSLRTDVAEAASAEAETPFVRARNNLLSQAKKLKAEDAGELAALIEELQGILDSMNGAEEPAPAEEEAPARVARGKVTRIVRHAPVSRQ